MNRLILELSDLANQPKYRRLTCQVIGAKKKFLLEHPCGAFVRNGTHCHRGISKEIRKLVVREDGTVLPEIPNLSPRFALGNIEDGPLAEMIDRYFERGYDDFDNLCRAAYASVLPTWDCVIVPWEQIVSERSETWVLGTRETEEAPLAHNCAVCAAPKYGRWKDPARINDAGVVHA